MAELKLSDIDADFIVGRKNILDDHWSTENDRMDTFEDLYLMDVWKGAAAKQERRVASPRAFNIVEGFSTLMLTRPPMMSVPIPVVQAQADERADRIEKYLWGAWYTMRLLQTVELAETYACTLGKGVVRMVYDDQCPQGDFPLVATEIDPRTYLHWPDVRRPDRDVEACHTFEQRRRDVEALWDVEWESPPTDASEAAAEEDWLDKKVEVIDYWREILAYEDESEEDDTDEPEEDEGAIARATRIVRERLGMEKEETEEDEDKPERKLRPVRKIIHAVVADKELIHGPVFVPGYERLPFVRWGGYRTPFQDHEYLSVLFPVAGGTNAEDTDKIGLIGAENDLLSMKLRIAEHYANSAWATDSRILAEKGLDMGIDALNEVEEGKKVWPLVNPGISPSVDNLMANIVDLSDMASLPKAMQGAYVGEMSGVSMNTLQNPVLMKAARLQRQREAAFEALNELILSLTEYWADDGWQVYGVEPKQPDTTFSIQIGAGEIDGLRKTRVQLSATMPRDVQAHALMLSQLVQQKMLSRRSAIDEMQRSASFPSQSVDDEITRILIEDVQFEDELPRKAMAMKAVKEYGDDALLEAAQAGVQQQPGQPGPAPPAPGPQGPMRGAPPTALSPYEVPPATGPEGMRGMEGQGRE